MASKSFSLVLFLLLSSFAASASAATFFIRNNCRYTVWPAGFPVGGGTKLDPGKTWTVDVPAGTSGRFWGRTGCSFNRGIGHCDTGDCAGALSCSVPGTPPATLAEYTIGGTGSNRYNYDISVAEGYNLPILLACSTPSPVLVCNHPDCSDAYETPTDDSKIHSCNAKSNFVVVFCG